VEFAGGKKYPVTIRDDYSRDALVVYFISHKSDTADVFARFLSDLKRRDSF